MLHLLSNTAAGITAGYRSSIVLMQASAVRKAIDADIARHMAAVSWEKAQVLAHSKQFPQCLYASMACSVLGSSLLLAYPSCMSLTAQMRARHYEWSPCGANLHAPA